MNEHSALMLRLKMVYGVPKIIEVNKSVTISPTERWCRASLLPTETEIGSLGVTGFDIKRGLFQIDLFTPLGQGDDYDLADRIVTAYSDRLDRHVPVGDYKLLIEKSWSEGGNQVEGWFVTSIFVRWSMPIVATI